MRRLTIRAFILLMLACLGIATVHAQGRLIRKMQEKAEDKIIEDIFKDKGKEPETISSESDDTSPARHRRGGGLTQTAPDVNQNIADATAYFDQKNYAESKAAVRQALWGVELEIGQNILKSLPESIDNLKIQPEQDRVSSTGAGFAGLVIERAYQGNDDLELRISIGNESALLGLAGMYMAGGMYQTTDETNLKQIRFKEHRATISYDEYDGYTLGVPFGQSSVLVVTGVNFENESLFMAAANNFDLYRIKKELGEQ